MAQVYTYLTDRSIRLALFLWSQFEKVSLELFIQFKSFFSKYLAFNFVFLQLFGQEIEDNRVVILIHNFKLSCTDARTDRDRIYETLPLFRVSLIDSVYHIKALLSPEIYGKVFC